MECQWITKQMELLQFLRSSFAYSERNGISQLMIVRYCKELKEHYNKIKGKLNYY